MTEPARFPRPICESRALVSGGTSGVGLATARRLSAAGVGRIALVGRNAERGAAARDLVAANGADVAFIAGDAGSSLDAERIAAAAATFLGGGFEIFVSAVAPKGTFGVLERLEADDVEIVLSGLVLPVMQMNRAVLPYMRSTGGTIVNVASDAAKVPTPGESVAGGAMAAIAMFSRTLALEVKRYGIRVHTLTPSLIAGTETANHLLSQEFSGKIIGRVIDKAGLGVPDANDLAEVVLFLASPVAAKMTGQVISVNGGISAG